MSEWWTYRPSDFLLFSARTYHRLFERYNAETWPVHLLACALALALAWLLIRRTSAPRTARAACALLAAAWLWIAWAFHLQRYADINWAAVWFAAAYALQGLLLLLAAACDWRRQPGPRDTIGLALFGAALFIQPWLTVVLSGRPWREIELFGLAPDPTALGTIGLLLVLRPARASGAARTLHAALWPVPLLWCLIGAMTRWTLHAQGHGG